MINNNINRRFAAIYIRTSSEHQGEKASPDEQEADCRRLAEEKGLSVVGVYRDTEKYRVKTRLVDPSGTRSDRPGLTTMLKDASIGQFDTILAWREDRLYRGMRAMLLVLETIQEHNIDIQLARETFDPKMAPLKAWVAQMELDGMRERMSMGVKARLRAGKANTGQDRYGYQREGETIVIVDEEAKWVRQIFEWYNDRVPINEIRRRLIEQDAPQKGSSNPRKIRWSRAVIQGVFKGAKDYALGVKIQTRNGEAFEIPIPPIIDLATYKRYLDVREANIKHRTHNLKQDYLVGGMIYCACNRKWQARVASYTRKNRKGEKVQRKSMYWNYYCPEPHPEIVHPNCPRTLGAKKADEFVWQKVLAVIQKPGVLIGEANRVIEELQQQAKTIIQDTTRIQNELDNLLMERQWVITQARKGKISSDDMDYQLGALTLQELNLKKDLAEQIQIANMPELDGWEEKAREYFEDLRLGIESLNAAPQTDEERHEIYLLKRRTVLALVDKVLIEKDKSLRVIFKLNVLEIIRQLADFCSIQKVGTYTHKRLSPAHSHHS